jgi:hypothetical protein
VTGLLDRLLSAADPGELFTRAVGGRPEPWQQRVLTSTARRLLLLTARQVGKSMTVAVLAAQTAIFRPGSLTLIVSGGQRQADELLAKVRVALSVESTVEGSRTELRLPNGSRVVSLPATEGTTRGYSAADLLIFDEAAWCPDLVFVAMMPTVAASGRVVALSTPGARSGWFYEAATGAASEWEVHKVTAEESALYDRRRIRELRSLLSERQFAAEYGCAFVGLTDSAFDPARVEAAFLPTVHPAALMRHVRGCWTAGLDLAAGGRDYSALVVAERRVTPAGTRQLVTGGSFSVFTDQWYVRDAYRWPVGTDPGDVLHDVAGKLAALIEDRKIELLRLEWDATGLGHGLRSTVRDLYYAGKLLNVQPVGVTITGGAKSEAGNAPKVDLVSGLSRLLHERRVRIASTLGEAPQLRRELLGYTVKVTAAGNERYEARTESLHDDLGTALMLAVRRSTNHAEPNLVLGHEVDEPDAVELNLVTYYGDAA